MASPPSSPIRISSAAMFTEVSSEDFLAFEFGGRAYKEQLAAAVGKTGDTAGVRCEERTLGGSMRVMWCKHNFGFLGGSLGCAEGERISLAFEHATAARLPVVVECMTGGARMQEGVLSLMQMAKVSVAVEAHRAHGLPFVSVLRDPTFGGVSASYAMQADVKIALGQARIGFAGPEVILNTMFEHDQAAYDAACPDRFQSAEYLQQNGGVDIVVPKAEGADADAADAAALQAKVRQVLELLCGVEGGTAATTGASADAVPVPPPPPPSEAEVEAAAAPDYTRARHMARPQAQDLLARAFDDFAELRGDGKVGTDPCVVGGLARLGSWRCVVVGTAKGHTPGDMQAANFGMPSPAGYRTALRLFGLAERFRLPVVTLVDTVGAWPSFAAEGAGQSEAIATNLSAMAALRTPIVTVVIGEGGSGGALGLAMGNAIGMLSQAYYGVISPEGAASILGKYANMGEAEKRAQFALDCRLLADGQRIYAQQLLSLGAIDEVILESLDETYLAFPRLCARVRAFVVASLEALAPMANSDAIVRHRHDKFRRMGRFATLAPDELASRLTAAARLAAAPSSRARAAMVVGTEEACGAVRYLAETTIAGVHSRFKGLAPPTVPLAPPPPPPPRPPAAAAATAGAAVSTTTTAGRPTNAKSVLDAQGPAAMAAWVRRESRTRTLITDTTMRDAHQSLLATRVRTADILSACAETSAVLHAAFSLECWGGATFDVAYRFLHEDPWERLRAIRAAVPNVCLQMLLRGANAVGYTSYPDNVVAHFVALAAKNGMDVFRIFDCFNDVANMRVAIDAVRAANKVAEVCVCYTADVLTSDVYDASYYTQLARELEVAGAHMIAIKDMAGLLKPNGATALVSALRKGSRLPLHFHTHATSGAALATVLAMVDAGCEIVDVATAALADGTSQPSMNALVASLARHPRDTGIDYLALEPLDMHWGRLRETYGVFECGMKAGSARVFDHQIPGGQYTNLLVQCKAMGLWHRWSEVLDMYRDVNILLGDIVKVTPSSKAVGDFALYLINRNLHAADVVAAAPSIDFPQSVFELLEGRLGFPHHGFPAHIQLAVLKGAAPLPRGERSSAALPPADFGAELARLIAAHPNGVGGRAFSDEDVSSSLLYPKVFADYVEHLNRYGGAITHLPTPAFWHGLAVGQTATLALPAALAAAEFGYTRADTNDGDGAAGSDGAAVAVSISLERVSGKKHGGVRTLEFALRVGGGGEGEGAAGGGGQVRTARQHVELKDAEGGEVFAGPMARADEPSELASPMPGLVEKVHVAKGQRVAEGDTLMTVSAMKMEVHVKAPYAGAVETLQVAQGDKVVEGALLAVVVANQPAVGGAAGGGSAVPVPVPVPVPGKQEAKAPPVAEGNERQAEKPEAYPIAA